VPVLGRLTGKATGLLRKAALHRYTSWLNLGQACHWPTRPKRGPLGIVDASRDVRGIHATNLELRRQQGFLHGPLATGRNRYMSRLPPPGRLFPRPAQNRSLNRRTCSLSTPYHPVTLSLAHSPTNYFLIPSHLCRNRIIQTQPNPTTCSPRLSSSSSPAWPLRKSMPPSATPRATPSLVL